MHLCCPTIVALLQATPAVGGPDPVATSAAGTAPTKARADTSPTVRARTERIARIASPCRERLDCSTIPESAPTSHVTLILSRRWVPPSRGVSAYSARQVRLRNRSTG